MIINTFTCRHMCVINSSTTRWQYCADRCKISIQFMVVCCVFFILQTDTEPNELKHNVDSH